MESFAEEEPTLEIHSKAFAFTSDLVQVVIESLSTIDSLIAEKSKYRSVARVDLNILRLAVYEFLYRPESHCIII